MELQRTGTSWRTTKVKTDRQQMAWCWHKISKFVNMKEGISKNIQRAAILETRHILRQFLIREYLLAKSVITLVKHFNYKLY